MAEGLNLSLCGWQLEAPEAQPPKGCPSSGMGATARPSMSSERPEPRVLWDFRLLEVGSSEKKNCTYAA